MSRKSKASIPLREFFDKIYQPRRIPACAPATRHGYNVLFRQFDRFVGHTALVSDLNEEILASYIGHRLPGRSAITVDRERSKILALANYACKKGYLSESPDIVPVQTYRRIPQAYTADEIARLLIAAGQQRGTICNIPKRLYWSSLFLVLYDTGCRIGSARQLLWTDYHFDPPAILFRAETQKQKADQLLKVSQQTVEVLEALRKSEREKIFPWPYHPTSIYNHVKRIFKAAGLPHGRRDLFQRIRRTTLSLMHQAGGDATFQAGHSSNAVTRKSYLDPTGTRHAADLLPRPVPPEAREETPPVPAEPVRPKPSKVNGKRPGWLDYLKVDASVVKEKPADGLSSALRRLIKGSGLSIGALSKAARVPRCSLYQFANDAESIPLSSFDLICQFFGVEIHFTPPREISDGLYTNTQSPGKTEAVKAAILDPANAEATGTELAAKMGVAATTIYAARRELRKKGKMPRVKRLPMAEKKNVVKAVLLQPGGAELSNQQIAERVGVSLSEISVYRAELESTGQISRVTERTGKDGKIYHTANIGKILRLPKSPQLDRLESAGRKGVAV